MYIPVDAATKKRLSPLVVVVVKTKNLNMISQLILFVALHFIFLGFITRTLGYKETNPQLILCQNANMAKNQRSNYKTITNYGNKRRTCSVSDDNEDFSHTNAWISFGTPDNGTSGAWKQPNSQNNSRALANGQLYIRNISIECIKKNLERSNKSQGSYFTTPQFILHCSSRSTLCKLNKRCTSKIF